MALILLLGVFDSSCEGGAQVQVTFQSATSETVTVYVRGEREFQLQPGESKRLADLEKPWREGSAVTAVSNGGLTVLDETITLDRLKELNFQVTIASRPPP